MDGNKQVAIIGLQAPRGPERQAISSIRWTDGQEHVDRLGFAEINSEIIFLLATKLALFGRREGEEGVVNAGAATVAEINGHIINNAARSCRLATRLRRAKSSRYDPKKRSSGPTCSNGEI
jgi:hypothetical protein